MDGGCLEVEYAHCSEIKGEFVFVNTYIVAVIVEQLQNYKQMSLRSYLVQFQTLKSNCCGKLSREKLL